MSDKSEKKVGDSSIIYVVMEIGDDYHGSRLVCAFSDRAKAKDYAKESEANQTRDCGSETCDHRYSYDVQTIDLRG